jgi:DNA modification methylase
MFGVKAHAAQRRGGTGNGPARLRKASVLRFQRPSGAGVVLHPTEKPIPLLRELIESSSRLGEIVLDPFMGSGSTIAAARLEGRRAIGIEVDEGYCEIAARRLEQGVLDFGGVA